MKILVAMSGGIDSSVVAHMLADQGHELIGVRFTLWTDPLAPALAEILPSKCCNAQTAARAKNVADALGITLHILNLEHEFYASVVEPFLEGFQKGSTPNPCIGCNHTIKFGKLIELADELGCEKLATGHYARTAIERLPDGSSRHVLLEATDQEKDQSYYLYGLSQDQLSRALFPLGAMQKAEVYTLARHFGIFYEEATYRESQDLCFFPEKTPAAFLRRHLTDSLKPGPIIRKDGVVVGTHRGLPLYTIGQRRGLRIGGLKIPLEVIEKDVVSNVLVVDEQGKERTMSLEITDLRWISWKPPESELTPFDCRTRSLSRRLRGTLTYQGHKGTFLFDRPQPPSAEGQHAVFYHAQELVGGGRICRKQS